MGYVPVAAQNNLTTPVGQFLQVLVEMLHEYVFHVLAVITAGSGRQIHRNDRQLVVNQFNVAPFGIDFSHAQPFDHFQWLRSCINAHTAVAFFLGIVKVTRVTRGALHLRGQVVGLGLQFLQADEVGVLFGQPVQEAFVHGGANAVQVCGYDAKHGQIVRKVIFKPFTLTCACMMLCGFG